MIQSTKTFLNIRVSAIVESIIALSAIVIVGHFFGYHNRFFDFHPHPFWIVLIFIVLQYGSAEALVCAFFCTLFLLVANLPPAPFSEDTYAYLWLVASRPILWFVGALLFGLVRDRQNRIFAVTQHKLIEAKKREEMIAESYDTLKGIKEVLEFKLVNQMHNMSFIYQTLQSLGTKKPQEVLMSVEDVVRTILQPKQFSLYSLGPQGLEILANYGWEEAQYWHRILPDTSLYQELISRRRVLSVNNPEDEKIFEKQGIMAAPLVDPRTQEIFGVLKIESIEYADFSLSTLESFHILCLWIGQAYGEAKNLEQAQKNSIINQENGLFSYNLLGFMFQFLEKLTRDFKARFAFVHIYSNQSLRGTIHDELCELINQIFPLSMAIFEGKKTKRELVFIVPLIPAFSLQKHVDKLKQAIQKQEQMQAFELRIEHEIIGSNYE